MPSLKEMAEEVMIDFDDLVEAIGEDLTPQQMAARFQISEELAGNLKDHFYKYGVSSVMGGD
ncbi:MAG: helix-turn-helix domain-containing protein [Bacillota bacterium]